MGELIRLAVAEMTELPPKAAGHKAAIIVQAMDVLLRARKMPAGPARNDLRQLARGLLNLHRTGMRADVQVLLPANEAAGIYGISHQNPASRRSAETLEMGDLVGRPADHGLE